MTAFHLSKQALYSLQRSDLTICQKRNTFRPTGLESLRTHFNFLPKCLRCFFLLCYDLLSESSFAEILQKQSSALCFRPALLNSLPITSTWWYCKIFDCIFTDLPASRPFVFPLDDTALLFFLKFYLTFTHVKFSSFAKLIG